MAHQIENALPILLSDPGGGSIPSVTVISKVKFGDLLRDVVFGVASTADVLARYGLGYRFQSDMKKNRGKMGKYIPSARGLLGLQCVPDLRYPFQLNSIHPLLCFLYQR